MFKLFLLYWIPAGLLYILHYYNRPSSLQHLCIILLLLSIMGIVWTFYRSLPTMLALLVIFAPFDLHHDMWHTITLSFTELLLVPIIASYIFHRLRKRNPSLPSVFIIASICLTIVSFIPSFYNTPDMLKSFKQLLRFSEIGIGIMLGYEIGEDIEALKALGCAFIIMGILQSCLAFFQLPHIMNDPRAIAGSFGHHNFLGAFLVFALFWGLATYRTYKKCFLFPLSLGIIISFYWSGFIGFLCVFSLFYLITKRNKKITCIALSLLIISGIALYLFQSALEPIFLDHTIANRLLIWTDGVQQFLQHPFIGCGIGTYHTSLSSASAAFKYGMNNAHNLYLQIAIEGGLCALLTIVFFIAFYCYRLFYNVWHRKEKQISAMTWLGMIVCVFVIEGFFSFLLAHRSLSLLLGITLGATLPQFTGNTIIRTDNNF